MRKRLLANGKHVYEDAVWFKRDDGSRYQRWAYGNTKAEVAEAKAALLKERRTRPRARRVVEDDPTRWKLADAGARWMQDHVCTLSQSTQDYYRIALTYRIAPYLYEQRVGQLRRRDIVAWRASLIKAGVSPRTINAALSTLKALYGWLSINWEDAQIVNPCARITPLDEHKRAIRIYEPGEVQRIAEQYSLLRAAQAKPKRGSMQPERAYRLAVRDATMTIVLAFCGLRLGELMGLQLLHYDDGRERDAAGNIVREREHGWLIIEQQVVTRSGKIGPVKGRRARHVPVLASVRHAIDWYLEVVPLAARESFMFPAMHRKEPAAWSYLKQGKWRDNLFKPAALAAGFGEATPHELRHTFASLIVEHSRGRVQMARLSEWMGHRDTSTTLEIYAHLYNRIEDDIMRDINAELFLQAQA